MTLKEGMERQKRKAQARAEYLAQQQQTTESAQPKSKPKVTRAMILEAGMYEARVARALLEIISKEEPVFSK